MSAFSVRQAGRIAASAISFLAWSAGCATGTHPGELNSDPLTEGNMAGTAGTGGTDLGGSGGAATAGDTSQPVAGMSAAGSVAVAGMGGGGASAVGGGGAGGRGGGGAGGGGGGGAGGAGGAGGGAGMAGNAGTAGAGGAPPVGFRYAKLVATSEQSATAVWSSVAELQIMTTGNTAISRVGWSITADSQELNNETDPATNAIDGDNATFWHTSWAPAPDNVNDAKLPHWLIVDMISFHTITGFSYLPRQTGKNGHIKNWEFYVSKDGVAWGTAVKTGAFPDVTTLQTVSF